MLSRVRPRDVAGKMRRRMAGEEFKDLVLVDAKLKALKAELRAAVLARGSHLMDLHGLGPITAARILADVGGIARFADRNRFASWTGTAPLDVSSGQQIRHRLSRAGNRRMNHAIHIAAIVQLRHDTPGAGLLRAQDRRRQDPDGSTALPQTADLRRRLPPAARRCPHRAVRAPKRGPGRAPRGVTSIQRGRLTPAHRHFGSATSRTRTHDATRATQPEEEPHQQAPATPALT